jgi:hypothetical protein
MRIVTLALLVLFVLPVSASEPGQPLDCSDWVFTSPGMSCSVFSPPVAAAATMFHEEGVFEAVDNEGRLMMLRRYRIGDCCGGCAPLYRLELLRFDGANEETLGFVEDRCNGDDLDIIGPTGGEPGQSTSIHKFTFDAVNGRVLIGVSSWNCSGSQCADDPPYSGTSWIMAADGFAPLLEIFQSYIPETSTIGLTTPTHPEGFQFADYFDTYWGDLATVGNWSEAQPLQCGYPATAPSVGDYLTVEDTLPTPASGRGYYYFTAVNYQGQRRYGRQSNGGVLTGRDPAVLPSCN